MNVQIARVDPTLPLPEYKTSGAVAFDIYTREDAVIAPHTTGFLHSNLIIKVPEGYFLLVTARSSTGKKGLVLVNGVGTIDQDFHGPEDEMKIFLYNFTDAPVSVGRGDRLVQGLIIPIVKTEWSEVAPGEMKKTSRGGFGSTG